MSEKHEEKYRCLACGEIVAYGKHCSKIPDGNLALDKAHQEYASKNGRIYEEIKEPEKTEK